MSGAGNAQSAADRLWRLIPRWYRRDDDEAAVLRALIDVFGAGLDAAREDVFRLLDDAFVETCAPELIPLVGDLVGESVDTRLPVSRRRYQVKNALHWRRRRGTSAQLAALGWTLTGFRTQVLEPVPQDRDVRGPQRAARISGTQPKPHTRAVTLAGPSPLTLLLLLDVAWPVHRRQLELERLHFDVFAIDPDHPVGMRRSDGTPILLQDDPSELVGPGLAIDVAPIGADFPNLGALTPRFMNLCGDIPPYVPHHTLAIDPEHGLVAGPTPPMPGIRAYRRYHLTFWEPRGAEQVVCSPAHQGDGVFTFTEDSRPGRLTDEQGYGLRVWREGGCEDVPDVLPDERLLVVRAPGAPPTGAGLATPFVLLPPGTLPVEGKDWEEQGLPLDRAGLNRLFAIEDEWGWDRFADVQLVQRLSGSLPSDRTAQVDPENGVFRVGPASLDVPLTVRFYRPYCLQDLLRRAEEGLRSALPLGRTGSLLFRDTAPGRISRSLS